MKESIICDQNSNTSMKIYQTRLWSITLSLEIAVVCLAFIIPVKLNGPACYQRRERESAEVKQLNRPSSTSLLNRNRKQKNFPLEFHPSLYGTEYLRIHSKWSMMLLNSLYYCLLHKVVDILYRRLIKQLLVFQTGWDNIYQINGIPCHRSLSWSCFKHHNWNNQRNNVTFCLPYKFLSNR